MPATTGERADRPDRPERSFEELATTMAPLLTRDAPGVGADALDRVPLRGRLRVSGVATP